jgi:hypothetical protein
MIGMIDWSVINFGSQRGSPRQSMSRAGPISFTTVIRWSLLAICLSWAAPVLGSERYFILVFASQPPSRLPRYSHTWATVVRAEGAGDDVRGFAIEPATISWVPADLVVRSYRVFAQKGVNLDLQESMREFYRPGIHVSLYGPYEIDPNYYAAFLQQKARLESGAVKYRSIDSDLEIRKDVSNCIHAITDLDNLHGRLAYSEFRRIGEPASRAIVKHLIDQGIIRNTHEDLSWITERLGLNHYPIERKEYRDTIPDRLPSITTFLGRFQRP